MRTSIPAPGSSKTDDLARRAAQLYAAGSSDEAIAVCQRMLRSSPNAWQALMLLGLIKRERNALDEAAALLQRAAQINPSHADIAFHLASVQADLGQLAHARAGFERLVARQPDSWLLHFRLGLVLEALQAYEGARQHYARAAQLNGNAPEPLINLGNVQRALGDRHAAIAAFQRAVKVEPRSAIAQMNLGLALGEDDKQDKPALEALEAACALAPDDARVHFVYAMHLAKWLRPRAAREAYARALSIRPDYADALNNLGVLHLEEAQYLEAERCFERCVGLDPGSREGWNNLGNLRMQQERWTQARSAFETALRLDPGFMPALTGLGSALNELGDLDQARACYEAALRDAPERTQILAALANVVQRQGDLDSAAAIYDRAIAKSGSGALRIKRALMLSAVMTDDDDIDRQRARLQHAVAALHADPLQTSEADLLQYPDTCFFLAYHGRDDRALLESISAVLLAACPDLAYHAPHTIAPRAATARVRIGFVSRYFHSHSVGLFFNPIIANLSAQPQFEVLVFSIGEKSDGTFNELTARCSKHVHLGSASLLQARRLIEREKLDVLVYPEIGMDPFTWLLSFARLGRVQCVLQGHSNTTGVPNIDWYVSSALIEPAGAQAAYSERLALLPTLPMHLSPPPQPAAMDARAHFDLPADSHLYLCPMKLQKVHPQMDGAFEAILARDSQAVLVLVSDHTNAAWDAALRARLSAHLGASFARVRFVPWLHDLQAFLALIDACDVVLDSFHHGGATTSHLALSRGKAIVTWPGHHARGRFLLAYYRLLEIDDCIAATPDDYVDIAVTLAGNAGLREALATRIQARIGRLHDTRAVCAAYAALFAELGAKAQAPSMPARPYVPLRTVMDWATCNAATYRVLQPTRQGMVPAPWIAGRPRSDVVSQVTYPECYVAQLADVEVIGTENLVLADRRSAVLYDSALRYGDDRVDIAAGIVRHRCGNDVLLAQVRNAGRLPCAIHLLGRGTSNYYHWLLEYLPRLQALEAQTQYADWPLLVDASLHPNLIAALERLCPDRRIEMIDPGVAYSVDQLIVLGPRVWMPIDYRHGATVLPDDILFAPEALSYLRGRLGTTTRGEQAGRRLYLRRGAASYRRLVNEAAIEAIFIEQGFEVVRPETLSLDEQIALFSQAEAIAGPTGAAMTNMVFAPPGCQVMVLYYPNVPFFYFSSLAAALGHELIYLLGESIPDSNPILYQLDFQMDPAMTGAQVRALTDRLAATRARSRGPQPAHVRDAIGFLAHIPELFNHYREIWKHLRGSNIEIVNAGEGVDGETIARMAQQEGLPVRQLSACLGQPRLRCMVSNHPLDPSGDPLIKRLARINVRLMYGLGKAGWNLQDWNALYDAILCFGPYQAEALANVTPAALVQVGYPRFDPFFHGSAERSALMARFGALDSRPTLVWLPTWKTLCSVPLHASAVAGLRERFNVIVKLHPLAAQDGTDSARILSACGFDSVITDARDNLPLYQIADYLLCDYGGPAFGGLYTDRRVLLLNVPGAESDELTGVDSPDLVIRQVVANLNPGSTQALEQALADQDLWDRQRVVRHELRQAFFAPHYGFAARVAAGALESIESVIQLGRREW